MNKYYIPFLLLRHFLDTGRNVPLFKYFDHFNNNKKKPNKNKTIFAAISISLFLAISSCVFISPNFFCCCYLFYHSHVRISSPLSRIKVSFHAYTYTDTCIQIEWIFFFESWKSVFFPFELLLKHRPWGIQYIYRISAAATTTITPTPIWICAREGESICQILSQTKFILLAKGNKMKKKKKFGRKPKTKCRESK